MQKHRNMTKTSKPNSVQMQEYEKQFANNAKNNKNT